MLCERSGVKFECLKPPIPATLQFTVRVGSLEDQLFSAFNLSDHAPHDHLRGIDRLLDPDALKPSSTLTNRRCARASGANGRERESANGCCEGACLCNRHPVKLGA